MEASHHSQKCQALPMHLLISTVLPYFGFRGSVLQLMQKLSRTSRESISAYSNLIERIKLEKLTWRTIVRHSIRECTVTTRLHMVFENRTLYNIRVSSSGADCCRRLFEHLMHHNSTGKGKALVFYASLRHFTLDMRKVVPPQLMYYEYRIGERAVLGMLLDMTTKKRGFKNVCALVKMSPFLHYVASPVANGK